MRGGTALRPKRVLLAPRPLVYRALTDPEELAKWWGPRCFTAPGVEFDPCVGGSYRIAMRPADGELFYVTGEFREVDPPAHLEYTFRWDPPDPDDRETVVSLSLEDRGERTEVLLSQGVFATEDRRALHAKAGPTVSGGWSRSSARARGSRGSFATDRPRTARIVGAISCSNSRLPRRVPPQFGRRPRGRPSRPRRLEGSNDTTTT